MSVNGASLADFVQMECMARSKRAFRVVSAEMVGYLYFDGGQIIHALTGDHTGEAAALEILNWRDGAVEPCGAGWPDHPTIRSNWQSLLLRVAQAQDESRRHNLVSFPTQRSAPAQRSVVPRPAEPKNATRAEDPQMSVLQNSSFANFLAVVRMDANGNVLTAKGDTEELAPIAAYAARLADLVGDLLGMERMVALECTFADERLMLHRERSGNLVALKATPDQELAPLRELFGIQ